MKTRKKIPWEEYYRRYLELTREHRTYEEAYVALEKEVVKITGEKKYSTYNSFRNSYNRRVNNNKPQTKAGE